MGSWLDLINIGIDVAQSEQIRQAQEELAKIQAGAQAEAARKMVLEIMRNYVFEIAQDINALEEHMQTSPQQVYIVARALEWRLSGISPEAFPDFADKEYVQQTITKIKSAIQQSRRQLSEEQLNQAEVAVSYINEMELLDDTIIAMSAKEELKATEPEWERLSKQAKNASNMKNLGCLALIGVFTIIPAVLVPISIYLGNINEVLGGIAGVISVVVWLACFVGSIILMAKSKPKDLQKMEAKRNNLKEKLLKRDQWEEVVSRWGNKSSQGYRDIQTTRVNFLRGMLGQADGFDKFLPDNS